MQNIEEGSGGNKKKVFCNDKRVALPMSLALLHGNIEQLLSNSYGCTELECSTTVWVNGIWLAQGLYPYPVKSEHFCSLPLLVHHVFISESRFSVSELSKPFIKDECAWPSAYDQRDHVTNRMSSLDSF